MKAKSTTKAKAKSQERLLNAVEHGWKPTGKKKKKKRTEMMKGMKKKMAAAKKKHMEKML